jgi:hypothetical protein
MKRIVNITSVAGRLASAGQSAYVRPHLVSSEQGV